MRQGASLDIIAARLSDAEPEPEPEMEAEAETAARRLQQDSRSTSSASSPVPPDNDNEESDFFLGANDSQSSLGVPNIQDMQVADDECLPPVQRLPNEIQIAIFAKLSSTSDILHAMLTCKRWARNAVDILWHRPSCSTWDKHQSICQTLSLEKPYFSYRDFVRRLNLSSLATKINDGSVVPFAECTRIERLTLTGCSNLTDSGLIALVANNSHLYSLDISLPAPTGDTVPRDNITEASIYAITAHCPRLQGLNISGCQRISNESLIQLARECRYIKRLKLNDCTQLQNDAVIAFAENCPNILEIDLQQCRLIGNEPVTALFTKGHALRELRLAGCDLIDDSAFLSLPPFKTYDHLRILDLSLTMGITDRAVERIIEAAPRIRNLVLQKCRNLTDVAVYAISKLGKNLHFLHLGHCSLITDDGVKRLVSACNRIRYIDLGCCHLLTDDSVMRLAHLPKLKRIGLVKCANITDTSVYALAHANRRPRIRRDAHGTLVPGDYTSQSCLERVHLSYCANLTQMSIVALLSSCPRLTHLSLTGVQAFLRDDLDTFSRPAPPEFTEHQRSVFCVFSGQGVVSLRRHLTRATEEGRRQARNIPAPEVYSGVLIPDPVGSGLDVDPDALDDEDIPEDGTEMVIDTQPLQHNPFNAGLGHLGQAVPVLPPLAASPFPSFPYAYAASHPPDAQTIPPHSTPATLNPLPLPHHHGLLAGQIGAVAHGNVSPWGAGNSSANGAGPSSAAAAVAADTNSHDDELPIQHAMIDISASPDANGNFPPEYQIPPPGGGGAA